MQNEQIPPGGKAPTTDVIQVISEIHAGVLLDQIGAALTQVAATTIEFGKGGEVTLNLKMKQIGESCQVMLVSTMTYKHALRRGGKSEHVAYETPLYVGAGGSLSITPETMELTLTNGGHPHTHHKQH